MIDIDLFWLLLRVTVFETLANEARYNNDVSNEPCQLK
jgi:hypothetical protein